MLRLFKEEKHKNQSKQAQPLPNDIQDLILLYHSAKTTDGEQDNIILAETRKISDAKTKNSYLTDDCNIKIADRWPATALTVCVLSVPLVCVHNCVFNENIFDAQGLGINLEKRIVGTVTGTIGTVISAGLAIPLIPLALGFDKSCHLKQKCKIKYNENIIKKSKKIIRTEEEKIAYQFGFFVSFDRIEKHQEKLAKQSLHFAPGK